MKYRIADYIEGDDNNFQFKLINTQENDYETLISSRIPEEVIFAVLGNFKNESPQKIVSKILYRILEISPDKVKLQRHVRQLAVLSKLRNLQDETLKQVEAMPIEFDIESNVIFQKGKGRRKERDNY